VSVRSIKIMPAPCIHCFNPAGETKDHVFPKSWYPDTTGEDVQRPTAPCCKPCNKRFGNMGNALLQKLGLCVDRRKEEASGIAAKALRAVGVGVESELSEKEKRIRAKLKAKLLKEAITYGEIKGDLTDKSGVLPGFGLHAGFEPDSQMVVFADQQMMKEVCGKIIRGLEHYVAGRYVKSPYRLDVFFIKDEDIGKVGLQFGPPELYLGPGFQVQRMAAVDGPENVIYRIRIWNTWFVHGTVIIDEPSVQGAAPDAVSA